MKTGILTFAKSINYGAALQAFALRKTVESLGSEAVLIDHRCPLIESTSKVFDFKCALSPAYTLAHLYNLPCALKRKKVFRKFCDDHFVFGGDDPTLYDTVITGSDQVWNYLLTGNDWFYYLDFPKNGVKKASYAASFGLSQVSEECEEKILPLLQDLDHISVRETTAADIVENITGNRPQVVLDPTLLLDKDEWTEISDKNVSDKGYIFVYTMFNSDSLWDFAYRLSKETGLPIKTVSYSKLHQHKADYDFSAGPEQWLSYMLNADYVVTNSFHGFAFSLNFQKQFYYELPPKSSGVGSRLYSIAETFGLLDRDLSKAEEICDIDYKNVSELLAQHRSQSLSYLSRIIKE